MWLRKPAPQSFAVGPYKLNMPLHSLSGLIEASEWEYASLGRSFADEMIYHAPATEFLSRRWEDVLLGVVDDIVYKIAPSLVAVEKAQANEAAMTVLSHCVEHLGKPVKQKTGMFMWDTSDGNTILQTAELHDGFVVNLFLTSSIVKTFSLLR